MKMFEATVFGKQGCDKCELLKKRLAKVLDEKAYLDFTLVYHDLGTIEGLVRFCQCETLNPQRIPGLVIFRRLPEDAKNSLRLVTCRRKLSSLDGEESEVPLFLETDYSDRGIITPEMIRRILDLALTGESVTA